VGATYDPTKPYTRPGTAISTNYAYGPFGVLNNVSVTARDANGGTTTPLATMQYDDLGRRTSLVDADSGQTVTTYDAFGETTTEADATGQMHIRGRDAIGRTVADYSTLDGTSYFQWDTGQNGIGKLDTATSTDLITTAYQYDSFGRNISTTWGIPGGKVRSLTVGRVLDNYGRVTDLQYPQIQAGRIPYSAHYIFDSVGAIASVTSADAVSPVAWSASAWEADGQRTLEQFGAPASSSSFSTSRTYDEKRGWLTDLTTAGGATQALHYGYDATGNVNERDDYLALTTERFHNDFLDRLDTWTYGPYGSRTPTSAVFTYTDLGNIDTRTTTSPSGGTTALAYHYGTRDAVAPGDAGVHAVKTVGADSYFYDARGNQLSGPGRGVAYTSFNLPKIVTTGAGVSTDFQYDAGGSRVLKTARRHRTFTGSVEYAGGLYERREDASGNITHVLYVPGADRVVAQVELAATSAGVITDRKVVYLHDDHLGSVESLTGAKTTTQHFKYNPFGQRVDPQTFVPAQGAGDVTDGFTDQEHDDELGLINMRGRMYDPKIGRFLSVDPLVSDPSSQGFNRYSYVSNNPLNFTDPTGFQKAGGQGPGCEGAPLKPGSYCAPQTVDGTTPPPEPGTGQGGDPGTVVTTTVDSNGKGEGGGGPPPPPPPPPEEGPQFGGSKREATDFFLKQGGAGHVVPQSWVERQVFQHPGRSALGLTAAGVAAYYAVPAAVGAAEGAALRLLGRAAAGAGRSLGRSLLVRTGIVAGGAAGGSGQVRDAAEEGTIVLGHYPAYLEMAKSLGAKVFSIPMERWNAMSGTEQWAANRAFLDQAIASGSRIVLATQPAAARVGSFFAQEIEYMMSNGYVANADGTALVKP
jgi:RHS repeat-associated protein